MVRILVFSSMAFFCLNFYSQAETYSAIVDENAPEMKSIPEKQLPKSLPKKALSQSKKKESKKSSKKIATQKPSKKTKKQPKTNVKEELKLLKLENERLTKELKDAQMSKPVAAALELPEISITPQKNSISAPEPIASKFHFYNIPVSQVDSLSSRLQIVHDILVHYGRAYDYKSLTLHELERIKKDLEETDINQL